MKPCQISGCHQQLSLIFGSKNNKVEALFVISPRWLHDLKNAIFLDPPPASDSWSKLVGFETPILVEKNMKTCRIWILELPTFGQWKTPKKSVCVFSTSEMTAISRNQIQRIPENSRNFSLAPYHPCHQTLRCTRTAVAPQKHPGSQNMAIISSIKARECTFQTPSFRFNIFEYIYIYRII